MVRSQLGLGGDQGPEIGVRFPGVVGKGPPLGSLSSASLVAVFEVFLDVAGSAEQFAFVYEVVSPSAQWSLVLRTGWSFRRKLPTARACSSRDVTVSGFGSAAWALAVAVAGDDGPALCGAPDPGFPADVEDF